MFNSKIFEPIVYNSLNLSFDCDSFAYKRDQNSLYSLVLFKINFLNSLTLVLF